MAQEIPFLVSLVVEDHVISQQYSFHNLRTSLRLAWELAGGIPSAWTGIYWKGRLIAGLQNDWKGRLGEANIYAIRGTALRYRQILVTPLNPDGSIFANVFAT